MGLFHDSEIFAKVGVKLYYSRLTLGMTLVLGGKYPLLTPPPWWWWGCGVESTITGGTP